MSLASDLLPTLASARSIAGSLGLRPTRCYAAVRTWSGAAVGEGTYTEAATELTESGQPPKVRDLSGEIIAVDNLESDTIEVGPLTPAHTGGGVSVATLDGTLTVKQERLLKVVGPSGTSYMRIVDVSCDRALHYMLRAAPQVE